MIDFYWKYTSKLKIISKTIKKSPHNPEKYWMNPSSIEVIKFLIYQNSFQLASNRTVLCKWINIWDLFCGEMKPWRTHVDDYRFIFRPTKRLFDWRLESSYLKHASFHSYRRLWCAVYFPDTKNVYNFIRISERVDYTKNRLPRAFEVSKKKKNSS